MRHCRICASPLGDPVLDIGPPAMSSLSTPLDLPTQVFVCRACSHAQAPDLPDLARFYDREYRISLQSEAHDQLYDMTPDGPLYRTEHQARLALATAPREGARVLDFGAGKAKTLQRMCALRPDLIPHVFDVSRDYVEHWQSWLPAEACATYEVPEAWHGRFDLITAHFVLEHVADPVALLSGLERLLAKDGKLFFLIPNAASNSGDLLVVDHINHFTLPSIEAALGKAGLVALGIDDTAFRGAWTVTAGRGSAAPSDDAADMAATTASLARGWGRILSTIDALGADVDPATTAIYGAGFYGSLVATRLPSPPRCFLDRNLHLQSTDHLGAQILAPQAIPAEVETLIVALNPAIAADAFAPSPDWLPSNVALRFLA
ncbi:MAG: methyltransferase domain-containing protein [Pseudomonadota bacterium]